MRKLVAAAALLAALAVAPASVSADVHSSGEAVYQGVKVH